MPVTHVNRKRDTYYLHAGKTKTGKPMYWFSTKAEGDLVESIPRGVRNLREPRRPRSSSARSCLSL